MRGLYQVICVLWPRITPHIHLIHNPHKEDGQICTFDHLPDGLYDAQPGLDRADRTAGSRRRSESLPQKDSHKRGDDT